MQFDTVYIYGVASLADWFWVAGATVWGALLAKLALLAIRANGARRVVFLFVLLGGILFSRLGTHVLANLLQTPGASNCYAGGPHWIALPIALVILAFRLGQPRIDRWLSLARALGFLNCAHAVWAMVWYPEELFLYIDPETRPGFETIVLVVPAMAICTLLAMAAVQILIGDGGGARGWREWLSARLQLGLAALGLLVQMDLLTLAAFPFLLGDLFLTSRFLTTSGLVLVFMAAARARSNSRLAGIAPA